ncbi:UNVERIFIED_CONTAM: hypothetical protein Sangu_3214200 [Sesamum angustifolium]|uniref:Reverse transcriptase domain-containing protein n=1 Tax=Sesamum angustifolium TaxID=2727405 RepID=A0AAW2JLY3_9LAMI
MLVNGTWLNVWPGSSYVSALPSTSDHSPLILTGTNRVAEHAVFRFNNYLAQLPGFLGSVANIWKHHIPGTAMYEIVCKLKLLKAEFRRQTKRTGELSVNVRKAKEFLDKAQALFSTYHEDIYLTLLNAVEWFMRGLLKQVVRRSQISKRLYRSLFIFQTLIGGSSPIRTVDLGFLQHELRQITPAEASLLVATVTAAEVKEAFFEIEIESAPGPDGFGSAFYRAAWPVVGQSMLEAVGEFFRTGKLLKQINTTLLALIPKVNMPTYVSDYRPISCCNVLYKAITKIIVKRLQRVLPLLINYSQNAFVPGRSISDNILLAQELLAGYNHTRLPERCTLKVDIQKAYDSVEWDFLLEVLRLFNFPTHFILIVQCVSTASFSVSLNGAIHVFSKAAGSSTGPLIDKVDTRLAGWNHQHLSYAGRLQLIKSVLSTLHMHWASVFILPKGVLKLLERKMRTFLWQGPSGGRQAKVAWDQICKPKAEGGLGLRSLIIMNQALILKQLWRVLQNDGSSIWVDWIQRYRLRHSTLWTFNCTTGSWCWKKMLKLDRFYEEVLTTR